MIALWILGWIAVGLLCGIVARRCGGDESVPGVIWVLGWPVLLTVVVICLVAATCEAIVEAVSGRSLHPPEDGW